MEMSIDYYPALKETSPNPNIEQPNITVIYECVYMNNILTMRHG
jgi:hypothetical protein